MCCKYYIELTMIAAVHLFPENVIAFTDWIFNEGQEVNHCLHTLDTVIFNYTNWMITNACHSFFYSY